MTRWLKTICAMGISGWLLATSATVLAQEYIPVEVKDLKDSPQRFWARGIVFRDVLKEHPGSSTMRLDDRTITRLVLGTLGEVYAPAELVDRLSALPLDTEYLFSATVSQRGRKYFFQARQKYVVLIKDVAPGSTNSTSIPDQLAKIDMGLSTNIYNRVFASLEGIMAEVQKDLFAYATTQNIPIETLFDVNAGHIAKVSTSIHAALRRAEERSKMPAQEYLVSLIIAMMAAQNGYVQPAPKPYIPEATPVTAAEPPMVLSSEPSESSWDLSTVPAVSPEVAQEVAPDVAPEVAAEPEVVAPPAAETQPAEPVLEVPAVEPEAAAEPVVEATKPDAEIEVVETVDPFWSDPEPVAVAGESKTAVEMINDVLATEPVDEASVVEESTESAPVEAEPAAEPASEPAIHPQDDPFWADPVIEKTPDESTEPASMDVTFSSGMITASEHATKTEAEPAPDAEAQSTPDESSVTESETPAVDESVPVEKPEKKKRAKKKKAKPEQDVVAPVEEPVATQDEIDYTKPLPLK